MPLFKCPACGAETYSPTPKCNACGAEFKFCPQCGKAMPKQQAFCTECGHRFQAEAPASTVNTAPPSRGYNPYAGPYNAQSPSMPPYTATQTPAKTKGKKFAIPAFILAMVTFFFVCFAWGWEEGIEEEIKLVEEMSSASSQYFYYIENLEEMWAAFNAFCIIAIVTAVISDALAVFAYIGHAKNVKNGVQAKYVLVFAIIATAIASLFGIIAMTMIK